MVFLQLTQVSEALKVCTNDTERASLENLKCDLQEILDLTRETLNELKGTSNVCDGPSEETDPFAREMAILMAEINEFATNAIAASKSTENDSDQTSCSEVDKFKVKFFFILIDNFSCIIIKNILLYC